MEITNNYNLPEPLYRAICNDKYRHRGFISTTAIIDAPQIRCLKFKHKDELKEDAINMVWALFGSANHHIIELGAEGCDDYISELKLECESLGKILSGTSDLYDKKTKTVYDYKVTSVWSIVFNQDHWQWEAQLNIYAYMMRQLGYEVENIKIIAILKDWKQSEVERNYSTGTYPPKQIEEVDIKVYSDKAMRKYIDKRMQMHLDAEAGDIPECNEKERWARPSTYAVKDPKKKRALKVCDNEKDAEDHKDALIEKGRTDILVEVRKGINARCEGFCSVAPFCEQFKKLKDE